MLLERELMRQADFIETSVGNVSVALRDGAILVAIILLLFLWNVRAAVISLAALPISLLVSIVAMQAMGITVNTMSLGGLTIAIGALVDDAIIDVENVFRRLRENRAVPDDQRRPPLEIVVEASREVRGSIVFATLIVMLVFVPLFFLTGVEGRLLAPLGFAYLVAIFASLVVALTVTPALCAYLLAGRARLVHGDSAVVRRLKRIYRPVLVRAIAHPPLVGAVAGVLLVGALALSPLLGRTFLPAFNEGALTIGAVTLPGTSLDESDRLGRRLEQILLEVPEVEFDRPAHRPRRARRACPGRQRLRDRRPTSPRPAARGSAGRHPAQGVGRARHGADHRPADRASHRPHAVRYARVDRGQDLRR